MNTRETLLAEIEGFLGRTGMSATEFGVQAVKDRALLTTLRRGRDPKVTTVDKIRAFMAAHRKRAARKPRPKAAQERAAA